MNSNLLRKPLSTYWLSGLLVTFSVLKSIAGIFFPEMFRDSPMSAGNAQGTEVVILFVAIPIMIISMILTARGSSRAQIFWLGSLSYILYCSVLFAFGTNFNPMFLVYLATLSLSFWSIVTILIKLDVENLKSYFVDKLPVKIFAIYILVIAFLFYFTWLTQIIPALFETTRPVFLEGTDMLTNPVHILDLGFYLPISAIGALWLWKRKTWGFVVSGIMISMMTLETLSIAVDQIFGHLREPSAPLDAVPLFIMLTLIGITMTIFYTFYIKSEIKIN